jgi:hypothetical protein
MPYEIRESADGGFSAGVGVVTAGILAKILDPTAPVIWIAQYSPLSPSVGGWQTMPVPLGKQTKTLRVRRLAFEIQATRDELIAILPDLEPSGLYVAQLLKPVPNTLRAEWLFEHGSQRLERCRDAGVVLTFDLPHAHEVAVVWSPERYVLEGVVRRLS